MEVVLIDTLSMGGLLFRAGYATAAVVSTNRAVPTSFAFMEWTSVVIDVCSKAAKGRRGAAFCAFERLVGSRVLRLSAAVGGQRHEQRLNQEEAPDRKEHAAGTLRGPNGERECEPADAEIRQRSHDRAVEIQRANQPDRCDLTDQEQRQRI